jgi:hypothetical protein
MVWSRLLDAAERVAKKGIPCLRKSPSRITRSPTWRGRASSTRRRSAQVRLGRQPGRQLVGGIRPARRRLFGPHQLHQGKAQRHRRRKFRPGQPLTRADAPSKNVRFGSEAEMALRPRQVRSFPESRHSSARVARPLSAISGHCPVDPGRVLAWRCGEGVDAGSVLFGLHRR